MLVEDAADLGHPKLARRALEQAHAQLLLQACDMFAELGFRHVQVARGGAEAVVFDDCGEERDIVEILHECLPSKAVSTIGAARRPLEGDDWSPGGHLFAIYAELFPWGNGMSNIR